MFCTMWQWHTSLSILTAIFPGEPGLASFTEAKDDGGGGDKSGAVGRAVLRSNRHHQQTNLPFLSPNKQNQSTIWIQSLHFNGHFPGEPGLAGVY